MLTNSGQKDSVVSDVDCSIFYDGVPYSGNSGLVLNDHQTKLLKTVVEYLNQASTALYLSNNRFLSSAAKDLAHKLGDQFCIG